MLSHQCRFIIHRKPIENLMFELLHKICCFYIDIMNKHCSKHTFVKFIRKIATLVTILNFQRFD